MNRTALAIAAGTIGATLIGVGLFTLVASSGAPDATLPFEVVETAKYKGICRTTTYIDHEIEYIALSFVGCDANGVREDKTTESTINAVKATPTPAPGETPAPPLENVTGHVVGKGVPPVPPSCAVTYGELVTETPAGTVIKAKLAFLTCLGAT